MTPLEALEDLLSSYEELCDDLQDNDIQYQKYNLTSPYRTIKKALEDYEELKHKCEWLQYRFNKINETDHRMLKRKVEK